MEVVLSLASLTITKILHFSGLLSDDRNVLRSRKMEEKALEVYGEERGRRGVTFVRIETEPKE